MKFDLYNNILRGVLLFVLPFCLSYQNYYQTSYKRITGYRLNNHIMAVINDTNVLHCGMQCSETPGCRSYNHQNDTKTERCELNNNTAEDAPVDYKIDVKYNYFARDSCVPNPCKNGGTCFHGQSFANFSCQCTKDYDGKLCKILVPLGTMSKNPAQSCLQIKNSVADVVDGPQWIDPGYSGTPFLVYCHMTTEGGEWLLVSNVIIPNSGQPPTLTLTSSYRNISKYNDNKLFISATNLRQLQQIMPFTQLRFQCYKEQIMRKIDIITTQDSKGKDVIDYFTAKTDVNPDSCGSFTPGSEDTSKIARVCGRWRLYEVGKWGHYERRNEDRLFDHTFYVTHTYHWLIRNGKFFCDGNGAGLTPGDFWKIYVR